MNKTVLKIADLITVPPVETVIQLVDIDSHNRDHSRGILSSFVVTDEIEQAFQQLFRHLFDQQGVGAFVKGNYGSGKSHFLAVLSLLLESEEYWNFISHPLLQEFQSLQQQKYLVVKIALHNYTAKEPLESIVFEEAEKAFFDRTGKPILLQQGTLLVDHFNRYILPQHGEFLAAVEQTPENWEHFCESHPLQAAKEVTAFIRSKHIPLKAQFDRRQSLNTLVTTLVEEQFTGVFLVVDELSEFLKSKPDTAAFSEDLRFLQFMGEACKQYPLYVVATLQESIEQTGYMEDDLVHRIKDRYPLRFSLSSHHVSQLISKRLVHKKSGTAKKLRTVYNHYRNAFPKMETNPDDFLDIYPVHPDTVTMLEGLTPLFSQHRGVVDFVYHQLTGDANRRWQGMLSLPAYCLMTPDTIFDHFRERIKEHPELIAYSEVVFKTIEQETPRLFESMDDQRIALKAAKILILVEISPIARRPTIQRLAQMVNEPVSDLEANLNYQYLEEVILDKLIREGSFISSATSEVGETVYFISLEQTVHQMVRNRVQEIAKRPLPVGEEFLSLFPYLRNALIPLTYFSGGQRKKFTFQWQNTPRDGWVYFKPHLPIGQIELETLMQQLKTTESDFALLIGGLSGATFPVHPPFGLEHLEGRFATAILGWFPRPLNEEEQQFLHRFYAYSQVASQLGQGKSPEERQIRAIVKEWLDAHTQELVTLVEDVYFGGRIADKNGWQPLRFSLVYPDFKRLLKQVFSPLLQNLFPRHSEIMPGNTIQPFAAEKLFVQFIRPGKISTAEAKSQYLDNLISATLSNLSLVSVTADEMVLSTHFRDNTLGAHLIAACEGDKPTDLFSLYWQMRKGEWGVTKFQFQLLLSASIASGRLSAFQSGNVVPFRALTQLSDGTIDAVGEGKLISEEIQQAFKPLLELEYFEGFPDTFSVATQEQIWRRIKQLRDYISTTLSKRLALAARYKAYPAFQTIVPAIEPDLELLQQFCASLRISYPAQRGLEKIAAVIGLEKIRQIAAEVKKLHTLVALFETRFAELNQMYTYLHYPALPKSISQAGNRIEESFKVLYRQMDEGDFLNDSIISDYAQQFYQLKEQYAEWYAREHRTFYSQPVYQTRAAAEKELAVQILKRFHRLESIIASPDWVTIQEALWQLETPCNRNVGRQLVTIPQCECGFVPGQKLPESQLDEIVRAARAGVLNVLQQLQTTYRWAIEEYLADLSQVGKAEIADKLARLLTFPTERFQRQHHRLGVLITDQVIMAINAAIRGKILILQRPVRSLINELSGKQITVNEARKIYEQWLTEGETVDDETHIHILGELELPEFDRRKYQGAGEAINEDGIRFFEAFWIIAWAIQHDRETWMDWVLERYRLKSKDLNVITAIRQESEVEEDVSKVAVYFTRLQLMSRLEQLINPEKMTIEKLLDFITNETLLEPLSVTVVKNVFKKIAPTEPLSSKANDFLQSLRSHRCRQQWSHLEVLDHYLAAIDIVSQGETTANLMAHYLSGGWRLPGLLAAVEQKNTLLDLEVGDRLRILSDRSGKFHRRLLLGKESVLKKELPLPYLTSGRFPKRLLEQLNDPPLVLLIIDAMRWDIWESLSPWFGKNLPHHNQVYLAAMEVSSLTTTEVNRPLLIQQLADATGALDWHLETVSEDPRNRKNVIAQLAKEQDLLVLNTTIVDTLLHERREPLSVILDVINTRMEALMRPLLKAIPPHLNVVITADHGFVEDERGYSHGGDSYFEKVVPFSLWKSA